MKVDAKQAWGNDCKLSFFLIEIFLLLYTAVIVFVYLKERFV